METKSGRRAVIGRSFIDCSGDGDLAAWAGAPYEKGDGQGNMLYPSTMFRLNGIDPQRAGRAWEVIPRLMLEAEAAGRYKFPRKTPIVRPQKSGIEWRVNLTQLANAQGNAMDGTDARELSEAEMLGRRQIASVAGFLKEVPGFENSYIVDIAPQVGIRETTAGAGPLPAHRGRRARMRELRGHRGRERLAAGAAPEGRCGIPLAQDSGKPRFQPPALPDDGSAGPGQPVGGRPLRFHEP